MAAHSSTPHFHNTEGLKRIEVGSKEFMCVGALPPFDHPHIFIDMGKDSEIVCPYCSTHYVFNAAAGAGHLASRCRRSIRPNTPSRSRWPRGRTIYIAGAGIAGMTLALALAKFGATVVVLERNKQVQEVGAGLQISPNARRVLNQLGLDKAIAAKSFEPTAIDLYPFRASKPLVTPGARRRRCASATACPMR